MNDPFELLGGLSVAADVSHLFRVLIDWLSGYCGVLCFSQNWHDAMLWSRYGDKHNGMCLGIQVEPKAQVHTPRYVKNRRVFDADMLTLLNAAKNMAAIKKSGKLPASCLAAIRRLLLTKFDAWEYEDEVRVFIELKEEQRRGCQYFADLDDDFQPVSLILGPRCRTGEREIVSAIGGYTTPIKIVRTTLAPNSFQVIEAS